MPMLDVIAIISMGFIAFFLGCSTYLLNTIRQHRRLIIGNLKEINAQYLLGFEVVTNEIQKLEERVAELEFARHD